MRTVSSQLGLTSCLAFGVLVVTAGCGGLPDLRDAELNKQVVLRYHEVVASGGQLDVIDEIVAEDYIGHGLPGQTRHGRDAFRRTQERLKAAFPNRTDVVEQVLAEGDFVVCRTILTGTHDGPFLGIPPTGREVAWRQFHVWRIVDGKITEHWPQRDDLGLLHQLGVVDVPDTVRQVFGWQSPMPN